MKPKVAIITSIYNSDEFLSGFLKDIDEQTYRDNCRLYLINCGDSQSDRLVCHNYTAKNYNKTFLVSVAGNISVYRAWNMGIKFAMMDKDIKYITNANTDDRLYPTCIEKHVKLLEENEDIDVAYCQNICTHVPNDTHHTTTAKNRYPTAEFSPKGMLRHNLPHNHPVWRRTLHDKYGFFDEELRSAADYDFWLRCAAGGSKFKLINENLGLYFFNPNGISTSKENQAWKQREETTVRRRWQCLMSM